MQREPTAGLQGLCKLCRGSEDTTQSVGVWWACGPLSQDACLDWLSKPYIILTRAWRRTPDPSILPRIVAWEFLG